MCADSVWSCVLVRACVRACVRLLAWKREVRSNAGLETRNGGGKTGILSLALERRCNNSLTTLLHQALYKAGHYSSTCLLSSIFLPPRFLFLSLRESVCMCERERETERDGGRERERTAIRRCGGSALCAARAACPAAAFLLRAGRAQRPAGGGSRAARLRASATRPPPLCRPRSAVRGRRAARRPPRPRAVVAGLGASPRHWLTALPAADGSRSQGGMLRARNTEKASHARLAVAAALCRVRPGGPRRHSPGRARGEPAGRQTRLCHYAPGLGPASVRLTSESRSTPAVTPPSPRYRFTSSFTPRGAAAQQHTPRHRPASAAAGASDVPRHGQSAPRSSFKFGLASR